MKQRMKNSEEEVFQSKLYYHRLQDGRFSILLKQTAEKTEKPQNPPKGLKVLKLFAVPEPLNILCLKTRVSNLEGDNKQSLMLLLRISLFFNILFR